LGSAKKNGWSIPRTASCLSQIHSIKHLDTATDLISHHRRHGNVLINLTGNTGLSLYASIPIKFRQRFFNTFKRNPRAVIGFTRSHFVIHAIKIFEKYRLMGVFMPFVALALILLFLPIKLVWAVFIGSVGILVFSIFRKFKPKRKGE
jgi:hypothetical protein